ncbi:MAG TPA: L,D-transpeptidase family protein [Rhizomicrobium sp.]|jgi:L,D-peptidoglycan transpeptidase YkuD (ErfK/YbiS/YcfS/YnhG family)|nr:L,D-transpeptidase family protein [Rhizomicrobium sp.]
MDLIVFPSPEGPVLDWGFGPRRCAIGPAGIARKAGEGDGITPTGVFGLRDVFWRADRLARPRTILPARAIAKDDGWCDAPDDPSYNRLVKLPYPASAENLWRDDHIYDIVVVIGFNDDPVIPGKGSAIFLHLAKPDFAPTAGCVALMESDLRAALEQHQPGDRIRIG